jgi:hypothetical protein
MGAVAAAAATAAAALAAAAVMAPAFAATRPADHATVARTAAHRKTDHHARRTLADVITSDFGDGGKYVTVVRCTGTVSTPPPVRLARLDDPLTVRGARPTASVVKLLAKPKAYKTVYACTVLVEEKAPVAKKKTHLVAKKSCELGPGGGWGGRGGRGRSCHPLVVLNTGFGGEAGPVASHHPAGRQRH